MNAILTSFLAFWVSKNPSVPYATLTALLCSSRKGLKKDLIDSSDIQEQLYGLPLIRDYLNSFYNCQYDQFFINLAKIENVLKKDRYFNQHVQFYIREMRLRKIFFFIFEILITNLGPKMSQNFTKYLFPRRLQTSLSVVFLFSH